MVNNAERQEAPFSWSKSSVLRDWLEDDLESTQQKKTRRFKASAQRKIANSVRVGRRDWDSSKSDAVRMSGIHA
jgi:hypothetical protein